jgi:hypothetical protein
MLFRNYYRCVGCCYEWEDVWSATCDDDCPQCGARHMSPYESEDVDDAEGHLQRSRLRTLQGWAPTPYWTGGTPLGGGALRDVTNK